MPTTYQVDCNADDEFHDVWDILNILWGMVDTASAERKEALELAVQKLKFNPSDEFQTRIKLVLAAIALPVTDISV
jgi:hypothetical protein